MCRRPLDIAHRSMHASRSEWLFFRELRVGTRRRNGNVQRLDASVLNSAARKPGMKRLLRGQGFPVGRILWCPSRQCLAGLPRYASSGSNRVRVS